MKVKAARPNPVPGYEQNNCPDCNRYVDLYMVYDDVWEEANLDVYDGYFCFRCLEKRLGRPLTGRDLPPYIPCNLPGQMVGEDRKLAQLKLQSRQLGLDIIEKWFTARPNDRMFDSMARLMNQMYLTETGFQDSPYSYRRYKHEEVQR